MLRISHSVPAVLLLLGVLAHIIIVWRAKGKGSAVLAEKLCRTRVISLPIFTVLAATLPITGWWLSHLSGRPLSQKWLMISIALLPLLFIFGGFFYSNLVAGKHNWPINKMPARVSRSLLCFGLFWYY